MGEEVGCLPGIKDDVEMNIETRTSSGGGGGGGELDISRVTIGDTLFSGGEALGVMGCKSNQCYLLSWILLTLGDKSLARFLFGSSSEWLALLAVVRYFAGSAGELDLKQESLSIAIPS